MVVSAIGFFRLVIYSIYSVTQGKHKQLTLVFIGALHTFHIDTNMYVCII